MDQTKKSEMTMGRDEGEEKSEVQRCDAALGAVSAGPDQPWLRGSLTKLVCGSSQPLADGSTFSGGNTISQYFHFRPFSAPSSALPQKPQLFFSSFFYEFLNCDFRTLIGCVSKTFELLSLWGSTNSPQRLNWLHKSNRKE